MGSLQPVKITFLLKMTWHLMSLKRTVHPALHRMRIPKRDAVVMSGKI